MKIGNVSQTIVPVPDFYLNKDRQIETFKVPKRAKSRQNKYYRDRDFFKNLLDINLNHNPRVHTREMLQKNQEKYVPIYNRQKLESNVEMKKTNFPDIIDNSKNKTVYPTNEYEKYQDYMKKTDVNEQVEPNLRKDLMNTTYQLLEKINANYDLKRWDEFDTRVNFNRHYQTAYSPITDYLNQTRSTKDQFINTLNLKAGSLTTVNSKARENVNLILQRKMEEKKAGCIDQSNVQLHLDHILAKNKEGLLRLKYNNKLPFDFNKEDQKLYDENQYLTIRTQDTHMYKKLPNPGRIEFDTKKASPTKIKFSFRNFPGAINKEKYNFKESDIFNCRDDMWIRPLHKDAFK